MEKGFTLLELLLSVMLMGVVYGSVTHVFERYKNKEIDVTLSSLRVFMQEFAPLSHVSLVCIKECRECLLFVDEKFRQNVTPFVTKEVRSTRYDSRLGAQELQLLPYFSEEGEEEVCFRYEVFSDATASEMMVEDADKVYVFPSYFGRVQKYESLDEAVKTQNGIIQKVVKL